MRIVRDGERGRDLTRRLNGLLLSLPMGRPEALGLALGGIGLCIAVWYAVPPTGFPGFVAPALMTLGGLAIARGVAGFTPRSALANLFVNLGRYANTLRAEIERLDIAHLPTLETHLDGPDEQALDYDRLRGRTVLEGPHGSGKSRFTAAVAAGWLEGGRRGLFVRLNAWTTSVNDLVSTALASAAGRTIDDEALTTYLAGDTFVVFDSIDEVALGEREVVATQIVSFAEAHPTMGVLVTARPATAPAALGHWNVLRIAPLRKAQVEQVLGDASWEWTLSSPVKALATNPLMLGLISSEIRAGRTPRGEAQLLEAFVGQLITRQAQRNAAVDELMGHRIAEDAAFRWLATERVAQDAEGLRGIAAIVAATVRSESLLDGDARLIETWLLEAGIAIPLGGTYVPPHRAVLDQLASRALPRFAVEVVADRTYLREVVARYLGTLSEVGPLALSFVNLWDTDLEFLSRALRLANSDAVWPDSPERFAETYITELRKLASGPLAGLGVIPDAVRLIVDSNLTSTYHQAVADLVEDEVEVVAAPPAMFIQLPGGPPIQVESFRTAGSQGQKLTTKVPQLAAYDAAKSELLHKLDKELLPDEGADITYERLCLYAQRVQQVLGYAGLRLPRAQPGPFTPDALLAGVVGLVSQAVGRRLNVEELGQTLVAWLPPGQIIVLTDAEPSDDDPYEISQHRRGAAFHGAPLLFLMSKAAEHGINSRRLSRYGLLPVDNDDPVLALPRAPLDRDAVALLVERHELAEMRSVRDLVERAFPGLSHRIPSYATLPWRIEFTLEPQPSSWGGGWSIRGTTHPAADRDAAVLVESLPGTERFAAGSFSRALSSYDSVKRQTYRTVQGDLKRLLSGDAALGTLTVD